MRTLMLPGVVGPTKIAVAALLLAAMPVPFAAVAGTGLAWADEHEDGGAGQGQDQGGRADENRGGQRGQDNRGGQGQGQGGPGEDSDARGPQAGQPAETGGGRPVWAQEGIPEVELGRLSVVRSPDQVFDRAYEEAIAGLTPEMIEFYNLSLDEAIAELSLNWDEVTVIDSPLQNLALLEDALDGESALTAAGVTTDVSTLQAVFLGIASDKTVPVTEDTVVAVTTILGYDLSDAEVSQLAEDAEAVRIAVLAGHG